MSFYSRDELEQLGLGSVGEGALLDRSVQIIGHKNLHLGRESRVDCFSLITAGSEGVHIGRNVHVGAGCFIFGAGARVTLEDYSGLSPRVTLFTSTDDFTSVCFTNPTLPLRLRNVRSGAVHLGRHAVVGTGSVVLPGVELGVGAAAGAMTLVRKSIKDGDVYIGHPMRKLATRDATGFDELEIELEAERREGGLEARLAGR